MPSPPAPHARSPCWTACPGACSYCPTSPETKAPPGCPAVTAQGRFREERGAFTPHPHSPSKGWHLGRVDYELLHKTAEQQEDSLGPARARIPRVRVVTVAVTDCSLLQALPSLLPPPPSPPRPRGSSRPFISPFSPSVRSRRPGAPHTTHDPSPYCRLHSALAAQAKSQCS